MLHNEYNEHNKVQPDGMSIINEAVAELERVIVGKEQQVRLALCTLLARGHLLIEDLPGMGKTTLSHALARVLGLGYQRIQFTSDLLPADILGVSVFDQASSAFVFHPGPIFSSVILADEINRATPKTQSALLEAMEEGQVTVEGETRLLPRPFFVIATQNPAFHRGTFPLPESQLDRFLMRITLGYPGAASERALFQGKSGRVQLHRLRQVMTAETLVEWQVQADAVHVSEPLLDYLQKLVAGTRDGNRFVCGLSPRGALGLLSAARAWALMAGRDYVIPEDLQVAFLPVCCHRIVSRKSSSDIDALLSEVEVQD